MSDVVNQKTVEEILKKIDQINVLDLEIKPKTQEYLETIQGYLKCFTQLSDLYNQVDPSHKLANHDMDDIQRPIQQLSVEGKTVQNLEEVYTVAKIMLPVFVMKMEDLVKNVTGDTIAFKLPSGENKLKGETRASEKAKDDYSNKVPGPPESWLYDIVRGSVMFDEAKQLFEFLELIQADKSIEIVKSKNRFRKPTLSGYRDWNLQLQISNEDGCIKHICELQLHLKAIKEADTLFGSHRYYEFFRKYYAGATDSLKERMEDLRMICEDEGGSLNMKFLIRVIENPMELERMQRLLDLFNQYMNDYQLAMVITNAMRDSLEPADFHHRMGNLLYDQGKYGEAVAMHQKALDIRLELLGPNHADTATSYNNRAYALDNLGKYEEAMMMYQKALGIQLEVLGPSHIDIASTYNNMAVVLELQGEPEQAMGMNQKALDIRLEALRVNRAKPMNLLMGRAAYREYKDALTMHQRALDVRLEVGANHADTARSYMTMGNVFTHHGENREALTMYQRALELRLEVLGPTHVDTSTTYNSMALVLEHMGKKAAICNSMARVLELRHKFEEAMTMHQNALGIRLKVLGPNHALTATTYGNMGKVRYLQGNYDEAMTMFQNALDIKLEVFGPNHASTGLTYNNMARVLDEQGNYEAAMAMYQKALDISIEALGRNHADTASTYFNTAYVRYKQRRYGEALHLFQIALEIRLAALGPDHGKTYDTKNMIAKLQREMNKNTEEGDDSDHDSLLGY